MTDDRTREAPKAMQPRVIALDDAEEIPGRRSFLQYFDLGIAEASKGLISTQLTKIRGGMSDQTGWHYHDCDFQWLLVTKGWLELQFENGDTHRIHENALCFIPGGYRHNETATSEDLEFIEIFMPPKPPTFAVDSPLP
ncbi:cupin domain-containing protein [Mycobacterium sp. 21AC1]|uniref:cupin domain-containing protein n=1 Tax=[Mycobacterium] appelbergii TaxID=2939269 RepID=UPI0029390FE9|nr:cupin domain-containing protein [Mycobacterium sp. 21AC1]MDV3126062.1 cupin domain-containing protein [Mycobacterium sp. 21AC1]